MPPVHELVAIATAGFELQLATSRALAAPAS